MGKIKFMEKKKIFESVVTWSGYELNGKLPETIAKLQKLMTDNPNHFDFEIEVESESGWYDSCSTKITIEAFRWETDEEAEKRIAASKKASEAAKLAARTRAEQNEKRERTLYESLKRKFEKEINEGTPTTERE